MHSEWAGNRTFWGTFMNAATGCSQRHYNGFTGVLENVVVSSIENGDFGLLEKCSNSGYASKESHSSNLVVTSRSFGRSQWRSHIWDWEQKWRFLLQKRRLRKLIVSCLQNNYEVERSKKFKKMKKKTKSTGNMCVKTSWPASMFHKKNFESFPAILGYVVFISSTSFWTVEKAQVTSNKL